MSSSSVDSLGESLLVWGLQENEVFFFGGQLARCRGLEDLCRRCANQASRSDVEEEDVTGEDKAKRHNAITCKGDNKEQERGTQQNQYRQRAACLNRSLSVYIWAKSIPSRLSSAGLVTSSIQVAGLIPS